MVTMGRKCSLTFKGRCWSQFTGSSVIHLASTRTAEQRPPRCQSCQASLLHQSCHNIAGWLLRHNRSAFHWNGRYMLVSQHCWASFELANFMDLFIDKKDSLAFHVFIISCMQFREHLSYKQCLKLKLFLVPSYQTTGRAHFCPINIRNIAKINGFVVQNYGSILRSDQQQRSAEPVQIPEKAVIFLMHWV